MLSEGVETVGEGGLSSVRRYAKATGYVLAELLWPTRCALCESPGSLLCERCRMSLAYIDLWKACPRCGAPFGWRQCTECNRFALERMGLGELPYEACVSAVMFDDAAARIVRRFKDAGEQGLASHIAFMVACSIPPGWLHSADALTCVPATDAARRRRGFDHCELFARECACLLDLPFEGLLEPGRARDQRRLGRSGRLENAKGRFGALDACRGREVILVDDVLTTGATLLSASESLKRAGARSVRCASFARVY